jgi:hypothetical protein
MRISSHWSAWLAGPLENPQASHRKAGIEKVTNPLERVKFPRRQINIY